MDALGPFHVICAGMYRACSTWQYEVIGHLLESRRPGGVARLGYVEGPGYREWARRDPAAAGWAVLKCHDKHPAFDRAIARGRLRVVYAYRDLRDVADSMSHKMGRPLDALLRQGLVPRILANDRHWSSRPGAIAQRYESIVAEQARAVGELAGWLGIALTADEAEVVASAYSLEANRRRTEALRRESEAAGVDLSDPRQQLRHDPATLLHWNHLRQGRSGGWRESLSVGQRARIAEQSGDWLIARGYETDRAWALDEGEKKQRVAGRMERLRARRAATIYFAARRYPRLADGLRRVLGMGPLETSSALSTRVVTRGGEGS